MYMSRIALNRRRRGGMKLLSSRHAMHAAVMSSFTPGTQTESESGRVLWRIDRHGEEMNLLIVSPERPCLAHIAEQAGWSTDNTWVTRDYRPFLESLVIDSEFIFRLVANPTRRMSSMSAGDGDSRKQIVGHRTVGHQRQWLLDRSSDWGFTVVDSLVEDIPEKELRICERDTVTFRRGSGRVTLVTAAFEGKLAVTEPDRLRNSLSHGIGRAKGYGCGLLTLLPVGSSAP
ncbi:type I-E CRISPR-associated protein Cas6/Cse3/CasE [Gordonia pseudamarae]|jgi:CRISPR system Cascade subunit CasE|uniref:Type I-E CRISPR-associated protein Cas6/Cse3/CasE n=1 Tax=Gordonia pseudamarae TaxID=2831662 RepID=A0ABX6IMK3_9ACTN|nr:type I-E CRISPR-associated protein Cas6/Cse3/CasE [Gordonia pseudamarae]MBD0022139.1 type I-E CRISPR-associated protein Cas6/Cse3/CasE [Gordonia sp. (in: high G+C Gram-positive bacteria)]QHN28158.1 type I-E CRISPR-associated protein Cas6/Cse3/CasE [Gordonia pseudamarae]QHN37020.1 type I-E CRISPR-associated protein Cas6/Cse3/CasE [Gordonia pseudamarae]